MFVVGEITRLHTSSFGHRVWELKAESVFSVVLFVFGGSWYSSAYVYSSSPHTFCLSAYKREQTPLTHFLMHTDSSESLARAWSCVAEWGRWKLLSGLLKLNQQQETADHRCRLSGLSHVPCLHLCRGRGSRASPFDSSVGSYRGGL